MVYILLILYIVVFCWWIKSSSFFEIQGLSRTLIGCIFISKIVAGLLYGFIHLSYFNQGDTFLYLSESNLIGQTFTSYPSYYIKSILGLATPLPPTEVFTYPDSAIFWKSLGSYVLVHLHALLYPVTMGYYELHIFFIAILGLFAGLNFYKVFKDILNLPHFVILLLCFGMPSLTFWSSGLHKDAYVYFGLSLVIMGLWERQKQAAFSKKLLLGLFIIALARYYLIALLIPALFGYWLTLRAPQHKWKIYAAVYTMSIGAAFLGFKLLLGIDLFQVLSNQQADFLTEVGNSSIKNIEPLAPSLTGVLRMLPIAVINVLGRPFLWECKDFLQLLASIEILSFLALVLFAFFAKKQHPAQPNPLIFFMFVYAVSNLMLVGLLVANTGTIVRYRAIPLFFISILLMRILNFKALLKERTPATMPPPKPIPQNQGHHTKKVNKQPSFNNK